MITGQSGAWRAWRSGDPFNPTLFAPTLDKLGAKLAQIGRAAA